MSTTFQNIPNTSGAGAGTITSGNNVGTSGVGVFDGTSGPVLNFKSINAGSNKINVIDDSGNAEIDIDVNPANIDLNTLNGIGNILSSSFSGFNSAGELESVPGWAFDSSGATQIGAQNSLTIPSGVSDFTVVQTSPTVSNSGVSTLAGVQINPQINQPITNQYSFQAYGYGTSAPSGHTSFLSSPSFSGTITNLTHFSAQSTTNATNQIGISISPSNTVSGNSTGVVFNPSGLTSGEVTGVSIVPDYTCAVTSSGRVKCWGYNLHGELGDETVFNRATPVDVIGF